VLTAVPRIFTVKDQLEYVGEGEECQWEQLTKELMLEKERNVVTQQKKNAVSAEPK
jgi:tRNA/tmRNA/rRNA uracil-C5-methylase (TrmA/RlmC/RlmD family)